MIKHIFNLVGIWILLMMLFTYLLAVFTGPKSFEKSFKGHVIIGALAAAGITLAFF